MEQVKTNVFLVGGLMVVNAILVCVVGFGTAGYMKVEMGRKRSEK